jgi:hypothetical protein
LVSITIFSFSSSFPMADANTPAAQPTDDKVNAGDIALISIPVALIFFWTLSSTLVLCGPLFRLCAPLRRKSGDVGAVEGDGEGGQTQAPAEDFTDDRTPKKFRKSYYG